MTMYGRFYEAPNMNNNPLSKISSGVWDMFIGKIYDKHTCYPGFNP